MSYDETLAARIRAALAKRRGVSEKKMFGGLCFMVDGKMCCGLTSTDFMGRTGKAAFPAAVARPHARPMDFTGRPSTSMVYVARDGLKTEAMLGKWIEVGLTAVANADDDAKAPGKRASTAKKAAAKKAKSSRAKK